MSKAVTKKKKKRNTWSLWMTITQKHFLKIPLLLGLKESRQFREVWEFEGSTSQQDERQMQVLIPNIKSVFREEGFLTLKAKRKIKSEKILRDLCSCQ